MSTDGNDVSNAVLNEHEANLVKSVLSHIRFPMMTPRQLAEMLLFPLVQKHKEFFVERLAIGMSFHSGNA